MSRIKVSELTELTTPSSNTENTFILVTDVSTGSPVSKKMSIRVLDSLIDISVNAANAALANANAAYVHANAAYVHANSSFTYQNASASYANSGFVHANASFIHANSSFNAQNATASYTNSAFTGANSAGSYANSGFGAANTADAKATSAGSYANSAFLQANTPSYTSNSASLYANGAFIQANAAFIRANNSLDANVGGQVTGDVTITGNLTVSGVTTYVNTQTVLVADNILTLNAAISQSGTPVTDAGIEIDRGSEANVYVLWNESSNKWTFTEDGTNYDFLGSTSASSYANSAFIHANSAYESQNASGSYANSAFVHANSGFVHANSSYESQNATGSYANSAFVHANAAFIHANSGFTHANSSYESQNASGSYANSAFLRANNSIDANNGGVITANLAVSNSSVEIFNVRSHGVTGLPSTSNSSGTVNVIGGVGVKGNVYVDLLGLSNSEIDSAGTSSANGTIEFYENSLYGTVDNTQGRGFVPVVQYRYMTANAATPISTEALPFLGNSKGILLSANSVYEIEWNAFFSKQTTATVGFAIRFGANPQLVNAFYLGGRAELGQDIEHPGPANSAAVLSATSDPVWLFTPVAGDGSTNYFHIKALVITNSTTSANCYLQANTNGGFMTPRIGSYMKVTKLPNDETGIYS
jgi:hypothetical protein